ncbi:MAG: endopeptidase La [Succinivibrionaceae bacterium]|nr:endopeptidase La [Succinivibrionaceae bacterium]
MLHYNARKSRRNADEFPEELHVIPIYGRPVMPGQITPVQVSKAWGEILLKVAEETTHKQFAIFSLGESAKDTKGRKLTPAHYPRTGCLVRLLHAKTDGEQVHFICEGIARVRITCWLDFKDASLAQVEYPQTIEPEQGSEQATEIKAHSIAVTAALHEMLPLNPLYSDEMRQYMQRFNENKPVALADVAASVSTGNFEDLQRMLDTEDLLERLKFALYLVRQELKAAKLQDQIKLSVSERLTKRQHDFFLREQLKEIKQELGLSKDDKSADSEEFEKRMRRLSPPEWIKKRFKNELQKLNVLETGSPEYGVTRNYLDVVTTIPWGKMAKEEFALDKAQAILDKDHEGLLDVKDRIIEFLATSALKGSTKGSIILFVGPPGVGKTSIGRSIANALHRPFYRLSLGGVNDESVIKGHRKTYIGSMPGKMVQALRETGVMNPVIMLDEIDKMTQSLQGDPKAALLEALDPEQNSNFLDHYLDERLDLSNCLFICTANTVDSIPEPLLDRMDPIRLSGYIAAEKFAIAKRHLLPRAISEAGMKRSQLSIPDSVLRKIIEEYARESGVRSLERALKRIVRKVAVRLIEGEDKVKVGVGDLSDLLGTAPFRREKTIKGVGVITGLAWTSVGGATLPVESNLVHRESRGFTLTGNLGDVMKESAAIALSHIEGNLKRYSGSDGFFKKAGIHLHVPEGATPKDGPSAGVTMASSLLSLALGEAPAGNFAMTGELSLTGEVLAIGGIREKAIAARRVGIFDLIVPKANEGDTEELPPEVCDGVRFYYADTYDDVAATIFPSVARHLRRGPLAPVTVTGKQPRHHKVATEPAPRRRKGQGEDQ